MSYVKATDVLPEEILSLIQNYIQGEYIYIPKKECNRKPWGETTKSKKETTDRNLCIYKDYQEGVSIDHLSEKYYLSLKSIQRIILKMKRENE
ncbi:CD3324 family protein [Clostridium sp.]|uniref:CD3324 family protein n=1 Tax=Clostridium sp. TaxID=1506 RepID=UPI002FC868F3